MAKTLRAILNKKSWTGKEVGRALLLNLKHDIECTGKRFYKPLFSQDLYNRMVRSLTSDFEYTEYKVLETIYTGIVNCFNLNEANKQQFYSGYYRYLLGLREAQRAESFFTTTEKFPLILTQAKYDDIVNSRQEYMRNYTRSYYHVFFYTLQYFMDCLNENRADSIPEDIRNAIEETKSQPVTNERILSNWAEDMGIGYYTLPDGRRNDNMSTEEWSKALVENLTGYTTVQLLKGCKILFKGEKAIREAYKEITGEELTDEELSEVEQALENVLDGNIHLYLDKRQNLTKYEVAAKQIFYKKCVNVAWHYSEEIPENLTKFDVISKGFAERYNGSIANDIPEREQFKEFKSDYPALTKTLKAYLEKNIPAAKELKASQYFKPFTTLGELADIKYLDYERSIEVTDDDVINHIALTEDDNIENFNRCKRGLFHGIAILKEAKYFDIGKNGEYIDPVESKLKPELLQGIDYLENSPNDVEYILDSLNVLALPALEYIYSFNALIDIIVEVYDLDFLTIAKCDTTEFENLIDDSNNMLYQLYRDVYGLEKDKKKKRAFIREHFQPIDVEELKPSDETVNALKEKLERMGYTREAAIALQSFKHVINDDIMKGGLYEQN